MPKMAPLAPTLTYSRFFRRTWNASVVMDEPSPQMVRRVLEAKDRGDYAFLRVRRGGDEIAVKLRM